MTVGELSTLGLYLVQQLGIMLGVGAATIMLIAHLVAERDGVVEEAEARFARAIKRVQMTGLLLMVVSGVVITVLHAAAQENTIIFSPAFVFKWLLIGIVAIPLVAHSKSPFPKVSSEGFFGATWYALFILHIVAPIAAWLDLLLLYAIWVVGFLLLWSVLARLLHGGSAPVKKPAVVASAPKPVAPTPPPVVKPIVVAKPIPPPPPVPVAPKPVVAAAPAPLKPAPAPVPAVASAPTKPAMALPAPTPALAVPHKPALSVPVKMPTKAEEKIVDPDQYPDLPAIRVMPRTPEDVDKQLRAAIVQFS